MNKIVGRIGKIALFFCLMAVPFSAEAGDKKAKIPSSDTQYFLQLGSFSSPETARCFFKKLRKYSCAMKNEEPYYRMYQSYYRVGIRGDLKTLQKRCFELRDLLQGTCVVHRTL